MQSSNTQNKSEEQDFSREVILAATLELERFAEGIAEHFDSYAELAKIAQSGVNPLHADTNYLQQAGFSAEVKHVARTNVEHILAGDDTRIARSENVGHHNHKEFDFVAVDKETGKPIHTEGGKLTAGGQMKVFKDNDTYRDLYNTDFEHYKRAELVIPKDKFDAVMADWAAQRESAVKQRDTLIGLGKHDEAQKQQQRIERIDDARNRAKPSDVSSSDAMDARKSPVTSVLKDGLKVAHRAGMEAAPTAAVMGGSLSLWRNVVAVSKNGKPVGEAAVDVLVDTGTAAGGAYATAATSAAVGGALRNANNQVLQNLGRSNAPAMAVQIAAMVGKNVVQLASGRMSAEDFVRHVTKDGSMLAVSMTGSNLGAVIGTAIFPGVGTIVGGLIGGMAASMLGGHLHTHLQQSVAALDTSNALRQRTHAICTHIVKQNKIYQVEMRMAFDVFFTEKRDELKRGFDMISNASMNGGRVQEGLAVIAKAMNTQLAFNSQEAFSEHLRSGRPLVF